MVSRRRPGRRVAARQLPRRAGAHRRGAGEPAQRLLPGAARAGQRPAGRLPPGLRAGHHADLAHRRAHRPRQRHQLRRGVPGGRHPDHRRALGGAGHAPAGPDRERAPDGAPHRAAARRAGGRRRGRRAHRGSRRPRETDALDAGAGPVRLQPAAAHPDLRLPLPAAAPGRGRRAPGRGPAGAVDRRRGAERGGGHRPRHPAAGPHPGGDGQQHHQPPRHRA